MGLDIETKDRKKNVQMCYSTYGRVKDSLARSYSPILGGDMMKDEDNPLTHLFTHNDCDCMFTSPEIAGIASVMQAILDCADDCANDSCDFDNFLVLSDGRFVDKPYRSFKSIDDDSDDTEYLRSIVERMIDLFSYAEKKKMSVVYN